MQNMNYKEQLEKQGVIGFVPIGNSMLPFLKSGKNTVIVQKGDNNYKPLDVILYITDGRYILHRVIKKTENGYITCGDNCTAYENIEGKNVLGIMVGYYQGKKYVTAQDKKYVKKVKKWYISEEKRFKKVKTQQRIFSIKSKIVSKIKGKR